MDEQALIGGLLQIDLTRRLGAMVGGTEDIKSLKYFSMSSSDWARLYEQKVVLDFGKMP